MSPNSVWPPACALIRVAPNNSVSMANKDARPHRETATPDHVETIFDGTLNDLCFRATRRATPEQIHKRSGPKPEDSSPLTYPAPSRLEFVPESSLQHTRRALDGRKV